jgi:hypothetical protein
MRTSSAGGVNWQAVNVDEEIDRVGTGNLIDEIRFAWNTGAMCLVQYISFFELVDLRVAGEHCGNRRLADKDSDDFLTWTVSPAVRSHCSTTTNNQATIGRLDQQGTTSSMSVNAESPACGLTDSGVGGSRCIGQTYLVLLSFGSSI